MGFPRIMKNKNLHLPFICTDESYIFEKFKRHKDGMSIEFNDVCDEMKFHP